MDYLIASVKTLIWLSIVVLVTTVVILFEAYGIPFIIENYKAVLATFGLSIVGIVTVLVFLGNLKKVREKRKPKESLLTPVN